MRPGALKHHAVIWLSIIGALIAQLVPLPEQLSWWRPHCVLLVVFFWTLYSPHRFGILFAWFTGLIFDVMVGQMLGLHALSFALVAYSVHILGKRLQMFPIWKQSLVVFVLIFLITALNFWAYHIQSTTLVWHNSLQIFTTLLFWPLVWLVLERLKRQFQIL